MKLENIGILSSIGMVLLELELAEEFQGLEIGIKYHF